MAWTFSGDRPVYMQLAQRIRNNVVTGVYPPGSQIPSVRQLAVTAAVNPNTVQHAFAELESEGLLVSKGTTGRFVTEDPVMIERCRQQQARALVREFVKSASHISISREQLIEMIREEEV